MPLDHLDDDSLTCLAGFLSPSELLGFLRLNRRFHALPSAALWRALCEARWRPWPRYRLDGKREEWLNARFPSVPREWIGRYRFFEEETARREITHKELQTLDWNFNFTHGAGGQGRASVVRARFTATELLLPNYPPLPYQLATPAGSSGPSGSAGAMSAIGAAMSTLLSSVGVLSTPDRQMMSEPQLLLISNFPAHRIRRLPADKEWLIENPNVMIVSCAGGALGDFDENGFLCATPPRIRPTRRCAARSGVQRSQPAPCPCAARRRRPSRNQRRTCHSRPREACLPAEPANKTLLRSMGMSMCFLCFLK